MYYLEIISASIVAIIAYFWYENHRILSALKPWAAIIPGWPILGNALEFKSSTEFLPTLDRHFKENGKTIVLKFGTRITAGTIDHRLLEFLLGTTKVLTKSQEYSFLHRWLGTGLLTAAGKKWKPRRKIITPAFHFSILEQFVEIFDRNGKILIEKLRKEVNKDSVDIFPFITLAALDIICETAMGVSVNAQNNSKSDYVRSVKNLCRIVVSRSFSTYKRFDLPYKLTSDYQTENMSLQTLHNYSTHVIKERMKKLEQGNANNKIADEDDFGIKKRKVFIDILLESRINGEPLTVEDIREEVDTFMFEGHDTTTSGMSFTLYCLAHHPEIQKRVLEEQKEIFNNDFSTPTTHNHLQSMKFLENVIKEALRLYPSVPFYGREVTEDIEFDGKIIPRGIGFIIYAFGMNRSPEYFTDPLTFNPDRFDAMDGKNPYSYLSFSAGPRNCIGQKFAMLEMKCTVSKIIQNFELFPSEPDIKPILAAETVLTSANGINIKLKKRTV